MRMCTRMCTRMCMGIEMGPAMRILTAHGNAHSISTMRAFDVDASAPRKATNLTINSDLLRIARQLRLNLSRELEHRLEEIVAEHRRARWLEENRQAIEAYNEHVERHGVWSDGLRSF